MNRPINTLFMLTSVDGKISTGDNDQMDFDSDLPKIDHLKKGLNQYYDIEKTTDLFSLNSGRVWEKIGFNNRKDKPIKIPKLNFVVIDNRNHLKESGLKYVIEKCGRLIVVTTNSKHPAFKLKKGDKNIEIIKYNKFIDFKDLFIRLKKDFGAKRVTVQTGGTLNAEFLRSDLIDFVSIVVAPTLIGGKDTSTLIDGESLHSLKDLQKIKTLNLVSIKKLKNSYLHLKYRVIV